MKTHEHLSGIALSSGRFELANKLIRFSEGMVFLFRTGLRDEQHVCLILSEKIEAVSLKSMEKPFTELVFDKQIYANNIPIKSLSIFLISASLAGNKIDAQVSPRNKNLDRVLPRSKL